MRELLTTRAAVAAAFAVACVLARTADAQDIAVKNARVVVAAANPGDARIVGTLDNPSMYPTFLVSATSEAAEKIELRDARKNNAIVKEAEIPAFGALTLEARGLHLKLVNPKRPLRVGERVEVTLVNEVQGKTRISAVVARQ
jgi:copper(I)-binding protein